MKTEKFQERIFKIIILYLKFREFLFPILFELRTIEKSKNIFIGRGKTLLGHEDVINEVYQAKNHHHIKDCAKNAGILKIPTFIFTRSVANL